MKQRCVICLKYFYMPRLLRHIDSISEMQKIMLLLLIALKVLFDCWLYPDSTLFPQSSSFGDSQSTSLEVQQQMGEYAEKFYMKGREHRRILDLYPGHWTMVSALLCLLLDFLLLGQNRSYYPMVQCPRPLNQICSD